MGRSSEFRKIESRSESVGSVLREPVFYSVPVYQRDFAWTSEQVDTFWEDVTKALEADRDYFLGAIVTSSGNDPTTREIVDGQQRLTILTMVFATIVALWKEQDERERAHEVFRDYLGSQDRRTKDINPKLTLNGTNNSVFQRLVVQGKTLPSAEIKTLFRSNKLLAEAHKLIDTKIKSWVKTVGDEEEAIIDLEHFIANRINIIVIDVTNESDAFVIFETLNDRGLELAVSDLVKNYIFSFTTVQKICSAP